MSHLGDTALHNCIVTYENITQFQNSYRNKMFFQLIKCRLKSDHELMTFRKMDFPKNIKEKLYFIVSIITTVFV